MAQMVFSAKKIASQNGLRGFASLLEPGFVCKFPKQFCNEDNKRKDGIRNESAGLFTGQVDYGLGFLRRYSTSIRAGSRKKFISKSVKGGSDSNPSIQMANRTEKEKLMKEATCIKKGDAVNLSELIFTKDRDYLIKCSDGQRVKFEQLEGKVVVIYFVDRKSIIDFDIKHITYLMNIYNELQPNNGFEVVFVDVSDFGINGEISPTLFCQGESQKQFEVVLSSMPWTAIPLSDITSRKYLKQRFGLPELYCRFSCVIDPAGVILQCDAFSIFKKFGPLGYPFTDERINYLKSEDDEAAKHPSLKALLASPQRDFLISNKGDKVPIHTLENKVVALYFYEEGFTDENITLELKTAYEELAKYDKKFEVVLIYLNDGPNTSNFTTEDLFWKKFKAMPWLAVPFRDPVYKKLERIFQFPWVYDEPELALTIIGPHAEFIEPFGVFILRKFKIPAFPFCRQKVATLLAEEAKEIKLEMLWDPDGAFAKKYGFQVQYSQLAGKRVIIIFESFIRHDEREFLEKLKERYSKLKGTTDEFEVIHIIEESYNNESKVHQIANLPWFVQLAGAYHGCKSNLFNFYKCFTCNLGGCLLIAFDRDGRVVRRTIYPMVEDLDFPFYDGSLEKEALSQLVSAFQWDCLYSRRPGMIYSYNKVV